MINFDSITFYGAYAELCISFIEYKRSVGYKYDRRQTYSVKYLCDYLSGFSSDNIGLTRGMVEGYIQKKQEESAASQVIRVYIVRQFGIYLSTLGYQVYLPPFDCVKKDKTFVPYIYTKDEIKRILKAAENLTYAYQAPNSYLVYPILVKILFGCGLRISEAVSLRMEDVNLTDGILHVRQSKFNNSRLVPMSQSLVESCRDYYSKVGYYKGKTVYFFEVSPGIPYNSRSCYNRFRFLLKQAGIWHGGRGNGPRLHDASNTHINKIRTIHTELALYIYPSRKGSDNNLTTSAV